MSSEGCGLSYTAVNHSDPDEHDKDYLDGRDGSKYQGSLKCVCIRCLIRRGERVDPAKVDTLLATKVARDARTAKEKTIAEYATAPTADLIDVLKARGYEVKLEGTCSGCGKVVDGPHYCPGPDGGSPGWHA